MIVSRFVPRDDIVLVIDALTPAARASALMTDHTPMMMPSIASSDRSLFARRLLKAMRTMVQNSMDNALQPSTVAGSRSGAGTIRPSRR